MWTGDVSVLNGIVMDVVAQPLKVRFISNRVFPESAMPEPAFSMLGARHASAISNLRHVSKPMRESSLDDAPTRREVCVTIRQRPYRVQVIRQEDNSVDRERMVALRIRERPV